MEAKAKIRKRILGKRAALTVPDRDRAARAAAQTLTAFGPFRESRAVMAYLDFRGEVPTGPIIEECLSAGKEVYLPQTIVEGRLLIPRRYTGRPGQLRTGPYGIREPDPSRTGEGRPELMDIIIVPGVAFDLSGNRLGYGGGFYDRFLRRVRPDALKVGLAYRFQVLDDSLPAGPHDIPMDYLLTSGGLVTCRKED